MQWFHNLKIASKVGCLVAIMLIANILTALIGKVVQDNLLQQTDDLYQRRLAAIQIIESCSANSLVVNALIYEMFASADPNVIKANIQTMMQLTETNNKSLAQLQELLVDDNEREQIAKVFQAMDASKSPGEKAVGLILAGQGREGYAYFQQEVVPHVKNVNAIQAELANHLRQQANKSKADFKEIQSYITKLIIAFIVITALVTTILAWYIRQLVSRPVIELVSKVKEIAGGNLSGTALIIKNKDEFGQLAAEINTMSNSLAVLVRQEGQSADQMTSAAEQLATSIAQSSQAANQVASSIAEVAQGATSQLDAMNKVTQVVEQMGAGIRHIAANASNIANVAEEASLSANKGEISVGKVMNQMSNIEVAVGGLEKSVTKLGERSREIGQIVAAISNISGQTNLLALNAAIEAARAGEQGRGFAVVAEEVRKLAEQSQDAAKQIATLIGEIQGDTESAVVSMANGIKEVTLGMGVVEASGEGFREITALIKKLSDQTQDISASSQQLASGSQRIISSIKEIDFSSKAVAAEAQTVSAATEEQSAALEEIAVSTQTLLKVSENLRTNVMQFRV
ncbi:MAG TPA: methyl-accepting chemotaxis protein [Negativicutes bacterium]